MYVWFDRMDFIKVVKTQREHYSQCFDSAQVMQLMDKFHNIQKCFIRCKNARTQSEQFRNCPIDGSGVFVKTWSPFRT